MILLLAVLLVVSGCDLISKEEVVKVESTKTVQPCDSREVERKGDAVRFVVTERGYVHIEQNARGNTVMTHCLPCSKAKTAAEKFVCDGGESEGGN